MELPLNIKQDGIYTFNLEIPYYNWFYPLQHSEDTIHQLGHSEISTSKVKGVYVHIPFCSSLCSFCPYIRTHIHNKELRDKYVCYLISEIRSYLRDTKPEIDCLFFGGGSPSLLSPENFSDIMEAILDVFKLSSKCEITIEANAMSLNEPLCAAFNAYNVSKIRIGIQSFNKQSRELYQLRAKIDDIVNSTELVRNHDILVSFDLLFGHHGQNLDVFLKDIDLAHDLKPDTIEIYPINLLSVPDRYWKAVSSMGLKRLRARDRIYFFKAARDHLMELGYHQWSGHGFSVSTDFDLLYHRCVYGTLGGILSFGPGAISFESNYMKWNYAGIERYMNDMSKHSMPTFSVRQVADYERKAKRIVTEIPYYGRAHVYEDDIVSEISDQLANLLDFGVIKRQGSELVLSDTARLQYASVMFYLLPERDKEALSKEILSSCIRLGNNFSENMLWI